jgi:hypothetical protein
VRQLVSGISIPTEYTEDNRHNRNLPVEINVLCVGLGRMERFITAAAAPAPQP